MSNRDLDWLVRGFLEGDSPAGAASISTTHTLHVAPTKEVRAWPFQSRNSQKEETCPALPSLALPSLAYGEHSFWQGKRQCPNSGRQLETGLLQRSTPSSLAKRSVRKQLRKGILLACDDSGRIGYERQACWQEKRGLRTTTPVWMHLDFDPWTSFPTLVFFAHRKVHCLIRRS